MFLKCAVPLCNKIVLHSVVAKVATKFGAILLHKLVASCY
jgi:hypothetical protein